MENIGSQKELGQAGREGQDHGHGQKGRPLLEVLADRPRDGRGREKCRPRPEVEDAGQGLLLKRARQSAEEGPREPRHEKHRRQPRAPFPRNRASKENKREPALGRIERGDAQGRGGGEEVKEEEFERMISLGHSKYQSFVILSDDEICGFCYIGQFRKKEAYDKSVEVTLYLNQGFTGKGIGKKAITFIENIAQQNDIKNLVAVITEGNLASITLFEKMGYFKVGHLKNIGEKFGKSLDVVSYQKEI